MSPQLLALAAFTVVFSGSARAQALSCQHRSIPVSFRDSQNVPIHDLLPADLEARVRGNPVTIRSLVPDTRPHRVVLVLDTSGSMGRTDSNTRSPWLLEVLLARNFFAVNRSKAQMAILTFNNRVDEIADFSPNNSSVEEELQRISAPAYRKTSVKGQTALRDAIFRAVQLLDRPSSADAIFVLTDGEDTASTHSFPAVSRSLETASVRLFSVLVSPEKLGYRNRTPESAGPSELSSLAREAGGEILTSAEWQGQKIILPRNPDVADTKVTTEETLQHLYQTIVQNDLMDIELPDAIAKRQRFELKLTSAARKRWKDAQVTYPEALASCTLGVAASTN